VVNKQLGERLLPSQRLTETEAVHDTVCSKKKRKSFLDRAVKANPQLRNLSLQVQSGG
jgi:hypothetical protein